MSIKNFIKRQSYYYWMILGCEENFYKLFEQLFLNRWYRAKKKLKGDEIPNDFIINDETDLVWDGFPGSANSTSGTVIHDLNGRSFQMVNHTHAANVIIRGIKLGKPTAVVTRNPLDSVCSLYRRWSFLSIDFCLDWYIKFHSVLLPYKEQLVVSDFSETTGNLTGVVERINSKFNTSILVPDEDYISQVIEKYKAAKPAAQGINHAHISHSTKSEIKDLMKSKYKDKLDIAERVYQELIT